jgi:hypothetical protein
MWRTTSIVWCVEFYQQGGGVFIGVIGAVIILIRLVIHQVLAGRPSHMAGRPSRVPTTDSRPQVPFHRHLESVTDKETHGRLQSGAGWPASLAIGHPPGPHINGLCTWPPRVRCIPRVALILMQFLISL